MIPRKLHDAAAPRPRGRRGRRTRSGPIAAVALVAWAHAVVCAQAGHVLLQDGPATGFDRSLLWLFAVVCLWSLAVGFVTAGLILERDRRRQEDATAEEEDADDDEKTADGRWLH